MINMLIALRDWIDDRLPIMRAWDTHMGGYYAPKNFNFWYFFGVLSLLVLVNQLLTGFWLTMMYEPSSEGAFASVEYIMRDVEYGWIIRYMHSTGASAFFAVVYLHMFRGLLYGSYQKPRELVWVFGSLIYLALMAEGFLGYVLPWGQMSYWGAQVIVSLFGAIPVVGPDIVEWVRGDYLISGITLNRFFALHVVVVPIVLLALVVLHLLALHEVGSNNPDGVEIKKVKDENGIPLDGIAFHPYYTVHDLVGVAVFLAVFSFIIFFMPEMGGYFLEFANFEEANPLKTPEHIAPVWYYTPFYSMLRAVTSPMFGLDAKFWGFVVMGGAVAIFFVLPWLDRSPVKSIRHKGNLAKGMTFHFAVTFIILGIMGVKSATADRTLLAQLGTVFYFAFFAGMPFWTNKNVLAGFPRYAFCWGTAAFFLFLSLSGIDWGNFGETSAPVIRTYGVLHAIAFILMPGWVQRERFLPVPDRVTMDGGMGAGKYLLAIIVLFVLVWVPVKAAGAESAHSCGKIDCFEFEASTEKADLQRGAAVFMNYCLGCHEAQYSRYERVATDLGIPAELAEDNFIFDGSKIGSLMTNAMPEKQAKGWFGATPPDLTLVTRARQPEWLYTYLLTFYNDHGRPWGVNNLVFKDVGMPNVMLELQGEQNCAPGYKIAPNGGLAQDPISGALVDDDHNPCGRVVLAADSGSQSAEEFEATVHDLVSFMHYMANPVAQKSQRIGIYVLLFVALFGVFATLLNREYWKDVH